MSEEYQTHFLGREGDVCEDGEWRGCGGGPSNQRSMTAKGCDSVASTRGCGEGEGEEDLTKQTVKTSAIGMKKLTCVVSVAQTKERRGKESGWRCAEQLHSSQTRHSAAAERETLVEGTHRTSEGVTCCTHSRAPEGSTWKVIVK